MNVRVEAGPIIIGFTSTMVEPTVKVEIKAIHSHNLRSTWACFSLPSLSVNGHSVSAINPEFTLIGGMATSVMA